MVQLKRNLLSVALASATMMLSAHAYAQSAPAQPQTEEEAASAKKKAADAKNLDTVVVTGIRRGIEGAIDDQEERRPRSSRRSPPKTSASCPTSASPNRSPACRAWPRSASPAAPR